MTLDLTPDQLLSTTRTVRKRLDLSRPVERGNCWRSASTSPSRHRPVAISRGWHFVVVTDADHKKALGELYRKGKKTRPSRRRPLQDRRP